MSDETLLKPREYKRDALGMFERPGATMRKTAPIKKQKKTGDHLTNPKADEGFSTDTGDGAGQGLISCRRSNEGISPMKRAALYLRVSTIDQTTANQERELRQVAERAGWVVDKVYKDHGISGSKGRDKRPVFDALHKAAARREIDIVMAWSVDRLGRSLQDLVAFLSEIYAAGVDLFLHQQGLDTTTPAGKALFQMMGVFAEFERSMI